jgi:hypothetical protein
VTRQRFRHRNDGDAEAHQQDLRQAGSRVGTAMQTRDQAGDGNVKETRCRQGQGIWQSLLGLIQPEIGDDPAQYGRQSGRHIQAKCPLPRHARMQKQREITDAMRYLMSRDGQRRNQPQRHTSQKGRGNQNAVERIVDAVANEDEHPGSAVVVMPMVMRMTVMGGRAAFVRLAGRMTVVAGGTAFVRLAGRMTVVAGGTAFVRWTGRVAMGMAGRLVMRMPMLPMRVIMTFMAMNLTARVSSKRHRCVTRWNSDLSDGLHVIRLTRRITMRKRVSYAVRDNVTSDGILVLVGMRMPPKHEFLDDEEHAEAGHERNADGMRTAGSNCLHGLRQQPQQGRADQRTCGKAHEVREHSHAGLFGKQKEKARERSARNTANRGEQDNPAEKRHSRSASVTPSRAF